MTDYRPLTALTLCLLFNHIAYAQPPEPSTSQPAAAQDTPAAQDTIVIPVGSQGENGPAIKVPAGGLKQAQVLEQFGEPSRRLAAVGKPPIIRWLYPNFTVYFEGDVVIHSVRLNRPQQTAAAR